MAFEGLREKAKDKWADAMSALQENATFNNLREQFESQSPASQRLIIFGSALLAVLLILSLPWSYLSTSRDNMTYFEENRVMIQRLLKAARIAKQGSPLPQPSGGEMLKGRVENILRENQLLPDQIGEISAAGDKVPVQIAPAIVTQTPITVPLKRLTLNQIVNLSHTLQSMGPGTKLMGMDITQAAGQTHYYDAVMTIVEFSLPVVRGEGPPSLEKRRGNAPGRRALPKDTDEDGE